MFHGNKYIAAGLAAGLAISALATPSFAQLSEGNAQRSEGNRHAGDVPPPLPRRPPTGSFAEKSKRSLWVEMWAATA